MGSYRNNVSKQINLFYTVMKEEEESNGALAITFIISIAAVGYMIYVLFG